MNNKDEQRDIVYHIAPCGVLSVLTGQMNAQKLKQHRVALPQLCFPSHGPFPWALYGSSIFAAIITCLLLFCADFCWMCLGDWKTHGSEYYECSRYKENPDIVNQSQQAQAREALKKYLFYFERVGDLSLTHSHEFSFLWFVSNA